MSIVHVQQRTPTSCAQACIAMLTGQDVVDVMRLVPHTRTGTRHHVVLAYLRATGLTTASRFMSAHRRVLPRCALVRVTWANRFGHLIVKHDDFWYDPLDATPFEWRPSDDRRYGDGRITSYVEIVR